MGERLGWSDDFRTDKPLIICLFINVQIIIAQFAVE